MPSGGAGLVSTASDYLRFSQMVLNGGALDGVRILAPSSVMLMRTNRLSQAMMNIREFGIAFFHISPGFGFGFDYGVYTDPAFIGRTVISLPYSSRRVLHISRGRPLISALHEPQRAALQFQRHARSPS